MGFLEGGTPLVWCDSLEFLAYGTYWVVGNKQAKYSYKQESALL
jgi:hypothetical protein